MSISWSRRTNKTIVISRQFEVVVLFILFQFERKKKQKKTEKVLMKHDWKKP